MTQSTANAQRQRRLQTQRAAAKAGMTVAMGVLVWSAMAGRRILRRYHPLAGVAMLGFTVWHMGLYIFKNDRAQMTQPSRRRTNPSQHSRSQGGPS